MNKKLLMILTLISLIIGELATFAQVTDVPMVTKDELKAMLGNADLVIFDVRHGRDFFQVI